MSPVSGLPAFAGETPEVAHLSFSFPYAASHYFANTL